MVVLREDHRFTHGFIELALAKQPGTGGEKMHVDQENGQRAASRYRLIDRAAGRAAWLELQPFTGRTHQLRVHTAAIGHPIVGDATYASDKQCYRTFLHAAALRLPLQPPFEAAETFAPLAPRGWSDVFEPSSPLLSPPAWPDAGARLAGELT